MWWWPIFIKFRQKFWCCSPKTLAAQKRQNCGAISDNFVTWAQTSPELNKILSNIKQRCKLRSRPHMIVNLMNFGLQMAKNKPGVLTVPMSSHHAGHSHAYKVWLLATVHSCGGICSFISDRLFCVQLNVCDAFKADLFLDYSVMRCTLVCPKHWCLHFLLLVVNSARSEPALTVHSWRSQFLIHLYVRTCQQTESS